MNNPGVGECIGWKREGKFDEGLIRPIGDYQTYRPYKAAASLQGFCLVKAFQRPLKALQISSKGLLLGDLQKDRMPYKRRAFLADRSHQVWQQGKDCIAIAS